MPAPYYLDIFAGFIVNGNQRISFVACRREGNCSGSLVVSNILHYPLRVGSTFTARDFLSGNRIVITINIAGYLVVFILHIGPDIRDSLT